MEFKGTNGEWYLQEFTDAYTNIIRCDNGEHSTIYIASTCQSSKKEIRFNALLMSKAPQMLEMLNMLLNLCIAQGANDEWIEVIETKKLIKEATEL